MSSHQADIEIPAAPPSHELKEPHPSEAVRLAKTLRIELGLSQQQLAELLRVSVRTVSRWECGAVVPDRDLTRRMSRLRRLVDRRLAVNGDPESVIAWLTTPQIVQCIPVDLLSSERAVQSLQVTDYHSEWVASQRKNALAVTTSKSVEV
jgi:transcriptional regulator with XRE-family HTH domain